MIQQALFDCNKFDWLRIWLAVIWEKESWKIIAFSTSLLEKINLSSTDSACHWHKLPISSPHIN
jgi:hypothetical protein